MTLAWLALFGLTLLLYTPFLNAPYFSDDFAFYYYAPPPHLLDYFWMHGVAMHAYRPAEAIILTLIQSQFGLNTWPIHLVSMVAHASLCLMVWVAASRLGYKKMQALFACALMLVAQIAEPALLGNDCMSQAMSATLGGAACLVLGIACLDYLRGAAAKLSWKAVFGSALCYFVSLFFKETALGLIIAITLFLIVVAFRKENGWQRTPFVIWRLVPYGVLILIYFAGRFAAGLTVSGGGQYRIGVGLNVIKNLLQFAFVSVSPASSVTSALALQSKSIGVLGWIATVSLLVSCTAAAGILASRRKYLAVVLGCCVLAALFPALLLQHVSELYVYNAYPYVALLLALALGSLMNHGFMPCMAMLVCGFLLLIGQVLAVRQKAALMNANGLLAMRLMAPLARYIQRLPQNSEVWLVQEENAEPKYSVYILHGLEVLEFGENALGPIDGRPDVTVRSVQRTAIHAMQSDVHRIVLEEKNGSLTRVELP